jgi:hypothetical protein
LKLIFTFAYHVLTYESATITAMMMKIYLILFKWHSFSVVIMNNLFLYLLIKWSRCFAIYICGRLLMFYEKNFVNLNQESYPEFLVSCSSMQTIASFSLKKQGRLKFPPE